MSEQSNDLSRRDLFRGAGVTLSAGVMQHVHHEVEQEKARGPYQPKFLKAHEYRALEVLTDLIVPGARAAGGPEFVDFLSSRSPEFASIFTGGLAWLDAEMKRRYQAPFAEATATQQTAMLDLISDRGNDSPALGPGIRFFDWARRLSLDAYYTSKAGMEELGFMGNSAMAEFHVPAEAIAYALKRSGLG